MGELSEVYGPDATRGNEHGEADQQYVDRSLLDFDPADGLYTGSAVEGTSDIPGPHSEDAQPENEAQSESERQS